MPLDRSSEATINMQQRQLVHILCWLLDSEQIWECLDTVTQPPDISQLCVMFIRNFGKAAFHEVIPCHNISVLWGLLMQA